MSSVDRLNPFTAVPDPAPEPNDAIEMAATPDAAQALDEAYAAVANSARMQQQTTQVSLPPIPDETVLAQARQQDKGTAVGSVMQVLAGAASGSIEDLVAQAVAIRSTRNNRQTQGVQAAATEPRRAAPRGSAKKATQANAKIADDGESADDEEEDLLSVLRRGAAVLRAPSQKGLRRRVRG